MSSELKLAELLSTRLCHDLAGPVGAVNNGAEILADEDNYEIREEAIKLIHSSSSLAIARLAFFRNAYGLMKENVVPASFEEIKRTIENFFQESKIKIEWHIKNPQGFNPAIKSSHQKILFNLFIFASSTIIRNGTIKVNMTESLLNAPLFEIIAERLIYPDDIKAIFEGDISINDVNPKTVQAFLIRKLCKERSLSLQVVEKNQKIELTLLANK